MDTPNLPIELLLKKVRNAVREKTNGEQTPWYEASIDGSFSFNINVSIDPSNYSLNISGSVQSQPSNIAPPSPQALQRGQIVERRWRETRQTNSVNAYNVFLQTYPDSAWHEQAIYYRDLAALKDARKRRTVTAYEAFLTTYPDSAWEATVVYERDQLAFEKAREDGTLGDFLQRYPNSDWRGQAEYYLQFGQ